ncbi:unnamed protein product [Darwinula stevensoni]|uniref:Vestigial n=1 Tax=Darwinula stevensoni TaxID=69355 RepID=A0A7R9A243_9CRUS|nr:unnamed protein product [Darwinula stevensoni]CAG0878835.1 unnamed protein product [Darwinula stevensoni]
MSCDVMYAPLHSAYFPSPYQRSPIANATPSPPCQEQKYKLQQQQGRSPTTCSDSDSNPCRPSPASFPSGFPSSPPTEEPADEELQRGKTTYVNGKCIIYTYYRGDIQNVVDQHFTKALNLRRACPVNAKDEPGKGREMSSHQFPDYRVYPEYVRIRRDPKCMPR